MNQNARQYYVLLCYYPHYQQSAIDLFLYFKSRFPGLQLVVINNSPETHRFAEFPEHTLFADADNRHGEFSGWQSGIEKIWALNGKNADDFFIFANDTAAEHRLFTWLDKTLFTRGFKQAMADQALAGEVNRSKTGITHQGIRIEQWLSTYLFCCPARFLLENHGLPEVARLQLAHYAAANKNGGIEFSASLDASMVSHINNWLFSTRKNKGWNNVNKVTADKLSFKANSIIYEKMISIYATNQGFDTISIYSGKLLKRYKRQCNRIWRARNARRGRN